MVLAALAYVLGNLSADALPAYVRSNVLPLFALAQFVTSIWLEKAGEGRAGAAAASARRRPHHTGGRRRGCQVEGRMSGYPWWVMVSSTMRDLAPERGAVVATIEAAGLKPLWAKGDPIELDRHPRQFCQEMASSSTARFSALVDAP